MELLLQIAQFFGYTYTEITDQNRSREMVDVRRLIILELRENDFTEHEIADVLQRERSTIHHALNSPPPVSDFYLDILNRWNTAKKFYMKIDFKINREKIFVINKILSGFDHINFHQLNKPQKNTISLRMELRYFFIRKTMSIPEKKDSKVKLPYHLASEFYDILFDYCVSCSYESTINGMDALKNDLHQKLQ